MKIVSLTAENVKKLTAVHITPDAKGGLVIISGKNGAGKSSVLDAITYALAGKDAFPSKPVRKGEDKAKIELDLGEFTVTRTITPQGGGSLIVRNKDAQKVESPQTLLDSLFGKLTFDPLEFRLMKPDKRSETLQALVGLDFKAKDAEIDQVFTDRTHLNREVKSLEAQLAAVKEYPDAPKERVSMVEVAAAQLKALEQNKANAALRAEASRLVNNLRDLDGRIAAEVRAADNYTKEIERLQKASRIHEAEVKALSEERARSLPVVEEAAKKAEVADIDLSQFTARMAEVSAINEKVVANEAKAKLRNEHKAKAKEAYALTSKIEALEKQKRQALADAKYPVPGLALSDTREVEVGGIPFDEVNTADQLRVSVAMGLAMNPKLRVLLVRQGNDLDDDSLKIVAKMAEDADAQIWIEVLHGSGQSCVVIEDGHIALPAQNELV